MALIVLHCIKDLLLCDGVVECRQPPVFVVLATVMFDCFRPV